jgi:hypothetical protein
MSSVPQKKNGIWDYVCLSLFCLPALSFVILLAQAGQSAPAIAGAPPLPVATESSVPETVPDQVTVVQPTTVMPPTSVPQENSMPPPQENPPDTNAEFLALYGDHVYPTLQSIPADMLTWYLTWIHRVAVYYDVPEEDILAVHYAELMGNGFRPLESRRSSADAAGPGQIIPETWNGWSCGSNQSAFMTDPAQIAECGGLGTDFDGDGLANVDSLPDNLAATARHIKNDGISTSLRQDSVNHESVLKNALAIYNSGKSYWQTGSITRTYADIGVGWWRENRELIPVYLQVYAPNA